MIPIEKNIIVVDDNGNEYEATYPKRAKGLVKNGRARFVGENKICLVCPPNKFDTEDIKMSENITDINENTNEIQPEFSVSYVLSQVEKLQARFSVYENSITAVESFVKSIPVDIVNRTEDCNKDEKEPGNHSTEETNLWETISSAIGCCNDTMRKMLGFYERVYFDALQRENSAWKLEQYNNFIKSLNRNDYSDETWERLMWLTEKQFFGEK